MAIKTRVLVIGGGPAGSSAARFLARNGIETILIERSFSYTKPCGGGIPSRVLEEVHIPQEAVKKHIHRVRIVSPEGETFSMALNGGSIAIVERGEFDRMLREEAVKEGVRLFEAEFSHFAEIGKTVTAVLRKRRPGTKTDFIVSSPSHDSFTVEADYVIAADGVNSRVRAALKIPPDPALLTVSEKVKEVDTDSCEFWFGSAHALQCYSWVFPQGDGITAGTGAYRSYRGIRNLWQQFAARRALPEGGSLRGYRVPLWQGTLFAEGRILFAGDAAGQVMPLTWEGIYFAMKSGEIAAGAIIEGKAGDYKNLWEKRFRKSFVLMRNLWRYFMHGDRRAETFCRLHRRPEVQAASMNFWFNRSSDAVTISSYFTVLKELLKIWKR